MPSHTLAFHVAGILQLFIVCEIMTKLRFSYKQQNIREYKISLLTLTPHTGAPHTGRFIK